MLDSISDYILYTEFGIYEEIPTEDHWRKFVKKVIKNNKLSIRKLGKDGKLNEKTVRRWLNGETSIRYQNLMTLLNTLALCIHETEDNKELQ